MDFGCVRGGSNLEAAGKSDFGADGPEQSIEASLRIVSTPDLVPPLRDTNSAEIAHLDSATVRIKYLERQFSTVSR